MSKVKWSKVKRGDVVVAGGRSWTVEKIKVKGKAAKVTIRSGAQVATSKVDLRDKVKVAEVEKPRPAEMSRAEKMKAPRARAVSATPPKTPHGDPWETQQDRIEKKLDEVLGARLAGEMPDGSKAYYVPPPDVTTIASHLLIFHGGIPETAHGDEGLMLKGHAFEHQMADQRGDADFHVPHWHTEKRPTTGKKKKG